MNDMEELKAVNPQGTDDLCKRSPTIIVQFTMYKLNVSFKFFEICKTIPFGKV